MRLDAADGSYVVTETFDRGQSRLVASDLEVGGRSENIYSICEGDPLSAKVICARQVKIGREEWQTEVITSSTMTCDADNFYVQNRLDAYEDSELIFTKTTNSKAPRDLM